MLAFLFMEPSTRTYASFYKAALELGISVVNIPYSSIEKGESLEDTLKTLELLGYSGVVLRHPDDHAIERCGKYIDIPIIDAGCGRKSHPSQAMIDVLTLIDEEVDPVTAKVAFLGDAENSRVYHSLLPYMDNTRVCTALEAVKWGADVFYCLRPQLERGFAGDNAAYYVMRYHMDRTGAYLMHPGPYTGVEFDKELLNHSRCLIHKQVENAVQVRKDILGKALWIT